MSCLLAAYTNDILMSCLLAAYTNDILMSCFLAAYTNDILMSCFLAAYTNDILMSCLYRVISWIVIVQRQEHKHERAPYNTLNIIVIIITTSSTTTIVVVVVVVKSLIRRALHPQLSWGISHTLPSSISPFFLKDKPNGNIGGTSVRRIHPGGFTGGRCTVRQSPSCLLQ